jgi:hypothetical protein
MTANELIKEANRLAAARAACFDGVPVDNTFGCMINGPELMMAYEAQSMIPDYIEFDGVICKSTVNFRGYKMYFQNRFYLRNEGGYRKRFSLAKAIEKLG